MWKKLLITPAAVIVAVILSPTPATAQAKAAKIASAATAGPTAITRDATVMDWPGKDGKMAMLRQGSNGWVCMPSNTKTKYRKNDAMCLDAQWQEWLSAVGEKRPPKITKVGYAYMLAADEWGSNTDPIGETEPTPTNQWHKMGPHVMVLYPDAKSLEGIPDKPSTNGPYIMGAGSPYAHVMWPMK